MEHFWFKELSGNEEEDREPDRDDWGKELVVAVGVLDCSEDLGTEDEVRGSCEVVLAVFDSSDSAGVLMDLTGRQGRNGLSSCTDGCVKGGRKQKSGNGMLLHESSTSHVSMSSISIPWRLGTRA